MSRSVCRVAFLDIVATLLATRHRPTIHDTHLLEAGSLQRQQTEARELSQNASCGTAAATE